VTSSPSGIETASIISVPRVVLRAWNAGRQCRNLRAGLPVRFMRSAFTWYGRRRSTRAAHPSRERHVQIEETVDMPPELADEPPQPANA
jgi:hypothetical protein